MTLGFDPLPPQANTLVPAGGGAGTPTNKGSELSLLVGTELGSNARACFNASEDPQEELIRHEPLARSHLFP